MALSGFASGPPAISAPCTALRLTQAALAQALAGVELDEEIPVELFEAVAEVIGFVLRARTRLD